MSLRVYIREGKRGGWRGIVYSGTKYRGMVGPPKGHSDAQLAFEDVRDFFGGAVRIIDEHGYGNLYAPEREFDHE